LAVVEHRPDVLVARDDPALPGHHRHVDDGRRTAHLREHRIRVGEVEHQLRVEGGGDVVHRTACTAAHPATATGHQPSVERVPDEPEVQRAWYAAACAGEAR